MTFGWMRPWLALALLSAAACGLLEEGPSDDPVSELRDTGAALQTELDTIDAYLGSVSPNGNEAALVAQAFDVAAAHELTHVLQQGQLPASRARLMVHAQHASRLALSFYDQAVTLESTDAVLASSVRRAGELAEAAADGLRTVAIPELPDADSVVDELQGIVILCSVPLSPGLLIQSNDAMTVTLTCGSAQPRSPMLSLRDVGANSYTVLVQPGAGEPVTVEGHGKIWTDSNIHDPGIALMQVDTCDVSAQVRAPAGRALDAATLSQLAADLDQLRTEGDQAIADLQALHQAAPPDWADGIYQRALAELLGARSRELQLQHIQVTGSVSDDVLDALEEAADSDLKILDWLEQQAGPAELQLELGEVVNVTRSRHDTAKAIIQNMRA